MRKQISSCVCSLLVFCFLLGLSSCYQAHSDDDLRTVPVTNNPNLVPRQDPASKMTAYGY